MEKNKGGRPLKFKTPEDLQKKIDLYFWAVKENNKESCDTDSYTQEQKDVLDVISDVFPTVTGLAIALDADRKTITNYENRDEFFHTIKRAKIRVENAIEQRLFFNNATGSIFNLKNNFGWEDKTTQDGDITLTVTKKIHNASD